jgi:hypothetical protein
MATYPTLLRPQEAAVDGRQRPPPGVTASRAIAYFHIAPRYMTLYHVASHRYTLHYFTSHHVTLHCLTLHFFPTYCFTRLIRVTMKDDPAINKLLNLVNEELENFSDNLIPLSRNQEKAITKFSVYMT